MRLITLGVGAADSPRYRPAVLLVARGGVRAMLDGGPGAEPAGRLDAWLVTDERAELRSQLRRLAAERGLRPHAGSLQQSELRRPPRQARSSSGVQFLERRPGRAAGEERVILATDDGRPATHGLWFGGNPTAGLRPWADLVVTEPAVLPEVARTLGEGRR
jgi:hypothetical protein